MQTSVRTNALPQEYSIKLRLRKKNQNLSGNIATKQLCASKGLRTTPRETFQGKHSVGTKEKQGNGNVQANVRANNAGQIEGTAHEKVGFRGKKGQKVHPNLAPNITMEFHYHARFSFLLVADTCSPPLD